jgi:hypothetical protein
MSRLLKNSDNCRASNCFINADYKPAAPEILCSFAIGYFVKAMLELAVAVAVETGIEEETFRQPVYYVGSGACNQLMSWIETTISYERERSQVILPLTPVRETVNRS